MAVHDVKGKTCLITGGAAGLGALYVESFLKEGAKYVAALDIAEDKGKALVEKLSKTYPGKVGFYKCDVGKEESIVKAFNEVVDKVKQLDVVINNAGIMNDSEHLWETACDVNWRGLVSFTLKAVKHMRKDQGGAGGTIVNVSSIAAFYMQGQIPIYHGSKGAVLHFSRTLALDPFYEWTGVRILTICFSATATALMDGLGDRVLDSNMHRENIQKVVDDLRSQRPEAAAAAFMTMFKTGDNGSVWLSQNNGPAQDITPTVAKAYDLMHSLVIV